MPNTLKVPSTDITLNTRGSNPIAAPEWALEQLESYIQKQTSVHAKLRPIFILQSLNAPDQRNHTHIGILTSGTLKENDNIRVTRTGQTALVTRITNAEPYSAATHLGRATKLTLNRALDISDQDVITLAAQPLETSDQFEVTLLWVGEKTGLMGRTYELKLANQISNASITAIKYSLNKDTRAHVPCTHLNANDIAVVNLSLNQPLAFEAHTASSPLNNLILIDKFSLKTVAVGIINHTLRRAQNIHRQELSISRGNREQLNGHKGKVIWFTGLSGSGKSTIANALETELHSQGKHTYILDGDNIRQGLNKDLGFTDADRVENIRRVAEVAKLMMDAGLIVMTAFISPFRSEREMARELIGTENFIEVFVDTPLEVCEQRDPKGLYKKARSGHLPNMTGINSPYEPPLNPCCVLSHSSKSLEVAVTSLKNLLIP